MLQCMQLNTRDKIKTKVGHFVQKKILAVKYPKCSLEPAISVYTLQSLCVYYDLYE